MVPRDELLVETGRALRDARLARGLTLRDVGTRSKGLFKPTAVAGYERAERGISLERFCDLARLYGMAPERLLLQILWRMAGGPEPSIDRAKVEELPVEEADVVGDFLQKVRRLRGDSDDEVIRVRIPGPGGARHRERPPAPRIPRTHRTGPGEQPRRIVAPRRRLNRVSIPRKRCAGVRWSHSLEVHRRSDLVAGDDGKPTPAAL